VSFVVVAFPWKRPVKVKLYTAKGAKTNAKAAKESRVAVVGYFEIPINTKTAATANPPEMRRHNSRPQLGISHTASADLPRRLRNAPVTAPCKK
jgi:hypothetical protein